MSISTFENGNAEQRTSGGLLVWRKVDDFTAFTDGGTDVVIARMASRTARTVNGLPGERDKFNRVPNSQLTGTAACPPGAVPLEARGQPPAYRLLRIPERRRTTGWVIPTSYLGERFRHLKMTGNSSVFFPERIRAVLAIRGGRGVE